MKTADNGKKSTIGRVAGIFAAAALVVVFAAGAWVLHSRDVAEEVSRDGVKEVSRDAWEDNAQAVQAEDIQAGDTQTEGIQEEEQSEPVDVYVQETLRESEACLERGEYLQAVQVLMDAQKEQADEILADREAYLRENIVVLGEQRYLEDILRAEYKYDFQGEKTEYSVYDKEGNLTYTGVVGPDGKERTKTAVWNGITTLFEYDGDGNLLKKTDCTEDSSIVDWTEYAYDREGNRIEILSYRADGSVSSQTCFNAVGVVTGIIYYDGDGSIIQRYETVCDDQGREITLFSYNRDGSVAYRVESEYDEGGNLVKSTRYDGEGVYVRRTEYEYDALGQRLRVIDFTESGAEVVREEYAYDNAGNRIKEASYNQYGGLDTRFESEYDAAGNCTKYISYDDKGNVDWTEYVYDEKGNQIEFLVYQEDGSLSSRIEKRYDEAGNETERSFYRGDGTLYSRCVSEYDETGRVLKRSDYGENEELESIYEYIYDPVWHRGTGYTYDSEGKLLSQEEWTFDILGNTLTYQSQNENRSYVYEYGLAVPLSSI